MHFEYRFQKKYQFNGQQQKKPIIKIKQRIVKKNKNKEDESKKESQKDDKVRIQYVNQLNDLIDEIFAICIEMPQVPASCIVYLKKFKAVINGNTDESADETEFNQVMDQLQTFIKSMELNQEQMKVVEEIINGIKTIGYKILYDMAVMRNDMKNMKKCERELLDKLDQLTISHSTLQTVVLDLKNEFSKFKQNTGDKVLASVYAHLLQPVIDRIDEAFRIRNEQMRNTPSPTSYNIKDHYKPYVLRNIKYGLDIDDEPTQLVSNVIVEFDNAVSLSKMQMVELLIAKTTRNYSVHGFIEHFIDDLVFERYLDEITSIQHTPSSELIIDWN
ncbi:unnamed protein product [Rotaria sordida]|uniref:Uncharacterized protein n=1 Tax=Rotaria sordida TaxID=392033 RepID=A0A813UK90_9BILA|nr:unnamed protein product [Rotaria sordida]